MELLPATAGILCTLLAFNIQAQSNSQESNISVSDELTDISNEKGTSFYLKLGLSAVSFKNQNFVVGGLSAPGIKFEKGFGVQTTLGMDIGKHAAIELELHRQRSNFTGEDSEGKHFHSANADYKSAMVNLIFRPQLNNKPDHFNPYIGAGLGITRVNYTVPGSPFRNNGDTVSAKQYILGNRFDLRDNFFIDTEYRYFKAGMPNLESEDGVPFELDNNSSQSVVVSYGKKF